MRRLSGLLVSCLALVGSCTAAAAGEPRPAERRPPNLVIILADDLGYGDVGVYGGRTIPTPHIDALAGRGVRLNDGYVAAAVCSPSRAALMTGRYPQRFGYHFNDNARPGLPPTETTLAERLAARGYATGHVGKWQLGWSAGQRPTARGFDESFGFASSAIYLDPDTPGSETWFPGDGEDAIPLRGRALFRDDEPVDEAGYLTDILTREAVSFIDRHHERPFFLYLAHYAPHVPLQAPAEYLRRFADIADPATRIYAAMVSALDDGVGAVVAALERHGLVNDTLIVFLSDNGCALYLGGACSNAPLAGGKRYQLEGGIRVPFIVSWPARLPAGATSPAPISSIDVAATFLAAAGGPGPLPEELDGTNVVPYLGGEADGLPHQRLLWRAGPNRAIRYGRWKLWQVNRAEEEMLGGLSAAGLLRDWRAPAGSPLGQLTLLYDLEGDVGETENLADRQPEIVRGLVEAIEQWDAGMQGPSVPCTRGTAARVDGVPVEIIF